MGCLAVPGPPVPGERVGPPRGVCRPRRPLPPPQRSECLLNRGSTQESFARSAVSAGNLAAATPFLERANCHASQSGFLMTPGNRDRRQPGSSPIPFCRVGPSASCSVGRRKRSGPRTTWFRPTAPRCGASTVVPTREVRGVARSPGKAGAGVPIEPEDIAGGETVEAPRDVVSWGRGDDVGASAIRMARATSTIRRLRLHRRRGLPFPSLLIIRSSRGSRMSSRSPAPCFSSSSRWCRARRGHPGADHLGPHPDPIGRPATRRGLRTRTEAVAPGRSPCYIVRTCPKRCSLRQFLRFTSRTTPSLRSVLRTGPERGPCFGSQRLRDSP